jgi:hypothetical protein
MAAFDSIRYRWVGSCLGLGTELVVRATRSICDGSLVNADSGRADTRARLDEWAAVSTLYDPLAEIRYDLPVGARASA